MVDDAPACGACPDGTEGDGINCADIDECATGTSQCDEDPRATCRNLPGTYECFCPANTTDLNPSSPGLECMSTTGMGGMNNGGAGGMNNGGVGGMGGGGTGGMGTGGMGTGGSDAPVDECALDTDTCDDDPDACTNTTASFVCTCPVGFSDTFENGTLCEPLEPDPCENGGCANVDECALNTDTCDSDPIAACANIPDGTYTCTCPSGFSDPSGRNCVDTDECALSTDTCDQDPVATCTNTPAGSYTCACPSGYSDPLGRSCVDIDECATQADTCDALPDACADLDGDYACVCPNGYVDFFGDGSRCDNIDECALSLDECDNAPIADCMDTDGSYVCICPAGTEEGTGAAARECVDIDECLRDEDPCDDTPNACHNLAPGYRCECPLGYLDRNANATDCEPIRIPLNEPGGPPYLGVFERGLYPGGNTMPAAHRARGIEIASQLQPLDVAGNPDANGKIVMLSIGMSNTQEEFCVPYAETPPRLDPADPTRVVCDPWTFMGRSRNVSEPLNRTTLMIVNGAYPGEDAPAWVSTTSGSTFNVVPANPDFSIAYGNYNRIRDHVLPRYTPAVSEAQIQVVWIKLATGGATVSLPDANADAYNLESSLGRVLRTAKSRYPNLKLAFLTSRMYGGYGQGTFSSVEPYSYEGGFSVKWLIEAQIEQMASAGTLVDPVAGDLNYDSGVAPWVSWGPYLWADGATSRAVDGLSWAPEEITPDGTHPTVWGQSKVGLLLMQFFQTSPFTSCWFMGAGVCQ